MPEISGKIESRCLMVTAQGDRETVERKISHRQLEPLPENQVRVRVRYSSLNYKDALCATGHPGVARTMPIVPGIDAAGEVVASRDPAFANGDRVMIFHAQFGTEADGGYSEFVDVPADWVYRIPDPLTPREAIILGTAGFTAAQCIDELQKHQVVAGAGEVVVTGATGGVGIVAVKLLAQLGYDVVAVTGKQELADRLRQLGAAEILPRQQVDDHSPRPLLPGRWAGAVDTVGGNTLATILRSTRPRGCVTACGLVGGTDFTISVYPFILRGVTLQGIDSAGISREYRAAIWQRLASDWALNDLNDIATETDLGGLEQKIEQILAGQIFGRVLVNIGGRG